MTSVRRIKVCVFCGNPVRDPQTGRSRAREHVFPAWALEKFGIERDMIEFSPMEAVREDGGSLQVSVQTSNRKLDLNNFLLGAVCSTCNHGWMSRLEARVKTALSALVASSDASAVEPKALAKWSVKTAYVLSRYLDPPVGRIPEKHGRQLTGEALGLPKGVAVFQRQATDWKVWFSLCMTFDVRSADREAVQSRYENAYKYLIQVGHAQFLIQYYPSSQIKIGFDPAICSLLDANSAIFSDRSLRIADSGIRDPDFLFMMSNSILEDQSVKIGRNDLCHCGSTLKFKHCHGTRAGRRDAPPPQNWGDDREVGG